MPTPFAPHIIFSHNARTELQALVRASSTPQSLGLRARIVLRAADTDTPTNLHIGRDLGCCNHTVGKWRRRYLARGLSGLQEVIRPGRPRMIASSTRVQVISVASARPPDQDRVVFQKWRWPWLHCPSKGIAVDKQAQDDIMHLGRFRKADGLAGQAFNTRP